MSAILSQIRSSVEDSFPAKPTPEQLKESAPLREAQRKAISDMYDYNQKVIIIFKKQISENKDIKIIEGLNKLIEFYNIDEIISKLLSKRIKSSRVNLHFFLQLIVIIDSIIPKITKIIE